MKAAFRQYTSHLMGSAAVLGLLAAPAAAQSRDHVFVDAGIAVVHDEAPRLVLGGLQSDTSSAAFTLGGGVWFTSRVGAGVEWVKPGRLELTTSGRFGADTKSETEQTFVGLVHVRAASFGRGAFDVVGGAGVLRSSVIDDTVGVGSTTHFIVTDDQPLTAWTAGANVTFEVVRHLSVGGDARLYWLNRQNPPPSLAPGATPSLADQSSTRFRAGAFVRGSW